MKFGKLTKSFEKFWESQTNFGKKCITKFLKPAETFRKIMIKSKNYVCFSLNCACFDLSCA